jgi:hypothetical protein
MIVVVIASITKHECRSWGHFSMPRALSLVSNEESWHDTQPDLLALQEKQNLSSACFIFVGLRKS